MALSLTCKKLFRLSTNSRYIFRTCTSSTERAKGLVLGVYENQCQDVELTPAAEKYNQISQGKLVEQLKLAGNKLKEGKSLQFWGLDKEYLSVAVVGLGKKCKPFDEIELISQDRESIRIAATVGCRVLDSAGIKNIYVESFGDAEAAAEGSVLSTWKFQEYRTQKQELPSVSPYETDQSEQWNRGTIKATAQNTTRRLSDTPGNYMTPKLFVENAIELLKNLDVKVEVHDRKWAEKERMGSFLSVANGSGVPPYFLELSYDKGDNKQPFVLVGKGITFDSGGISIKQSKNMDWMRGDMTGAACVISTIYGLARLETPVSIKALMPLTQNMPSGESTKPGDVVIARNGKSICVNNTDAEGRLVLADALSYSEVFNPKWVVNVATLTGAMVVALGPAAASGVFSNSDKLYKILEVAACNTGDRVWRFPLWKFYTKLITENNAYDVNNAPEVAGGGSCTAAAFLREFVPENVDWMHMDIAPHVTMNDSLPYLGKGASGRPTRTLIEFVEAQAQNKHKS